ncbi:MAG: tRNA adenosine(34) deaminase TadA [Clostridia bacterium]|nr:tRNA adenosine(34) deaminase TadA [Clostridia bacterium]
MKVALREAKKAEEKSEVPVGAVIVRDGKIIARAHNVRTTAHDPTAHAEVIALRKAGKKLGAWNLEGCELYVTKEPCVMCAGAIVLSRIKRVRYGAFDKRFGCGGTVLNLTNNPVFNHRAETEGGFMEAECAGMLTDFFKARRVKKDKTEEQGE